MYSQQTSSLISRERPQSPGLSWTSDTRNKSFGSSNGSSSSEPFSPSSTTFHSTDSIISSNKNTPSPPVFSTSSLTSPKIRRDGNSPLPGTESDSFSYGQHSPKQSPHSQRRSSPSGYNRSPRGSISFIDRSPSPSPTTVSYDQSSWSAPFHTSSNLLSPYDGSQMGRRSPRPDRSPSPLLFNQQMSNTLPRNLTSFRQPGEWLLCPIYKTVSYQIWATVCSRIIPVLLWRVLACRHHAYITLLLTIFERILLYFCYFSGTLCFAYIMKIFSRLLKWALVE